MATLEDENNITKGLDRVADEVIGTQIAAYKSADLVNSGIGLARIVTNNNLSQIIEILDAMKSAASERKMPDPAASLQNTERDIILNEIDSNTLYTYENNMSIKEILAAHFEEAAVIEEERKAEKEKSDNEIKTILHDLSGSLTEYFEEVSDKADDEEDKKDIIGGMIGSVKSFFNEMFSSGLGKLFKGVQVSITKASIKDFVGGFKPLIAAGVIGVEGSQKQGFKGAVGNRVGQAAGKGIDSIVSAISRTITKVGNALVRFINIWATGAPLVPPLLAAALVIVVGLYFITEMIIDKFYPLFDMITQQICNFFPQVIEAIMATSPFGAIVLVVKTIAKLIAALTGVDIDNPKGKDNKDLPYESQLDNIVEVLNFIAFKLGLKKLNVDKKEQTEKETFIKADNGVTTNMSNSSNASQTFNSVSNTVSNAANANIQNSTMETSENVFVNSFDTMVAKLLAPLNNIETLISDFVQSVAERAEDEPIMQGSSSSIKMQNLNNTNFASNNITTADGVIPGGNSISYTSYSNSQYTDLNAGDGNEKLVNAVNAILDFLKKESLEKYSYSEDSAIQGG